MGDMVCENGSNGTLDEIIRKLEAVAIQPDGSLTITPGVFNLSVIDGFFANVLHSTTLTLGAASRTRKGESQGIVVTGTADVLGFSALTLTLTFAGDDGPVDITLEAGFPKERSFAPPLLTWLSFSGMGFTADYCGDSGMVLFSFHGLVSTPKEPGVSIPFRLRPSPPTGWELAFNGDDSAPVNGEQLAALLGGEALTSFIPPLLSKALEGIALTGLSAVFDVESRSISYLSVGIETTNGWDIAPKVGLEKGLRLSLTLVNPTESAKKLIAGQVTGTFRLNDTTEVPLFVQASAGSATLWSAGLQPGHSVTIPSLSDLLGLAGGPDFLESLPAALSRIPAIEVDRLMITFDPSRKTLNEVAFSIQTASAWPVVEGYFEVTSLFVALDITGIISDQTPVVQGRVRGVFDIDGVPLQCAVERAGSDAGWTLSAGLPAGRTVDLVQVAARLLHGAIRLPEQLPSVAFSELQISIDTVTGLFKFAATSSVQWESFGAKDFRIETFALNFARDPAKTDALVTGTLATTLKIGEVDLNLVASLNAAPDGGWLFVGETPAGKPIPVGELIERIGNAFGVRDLPEFITGITVQGLKVSFNTTTKNFVFALNGTIPLAGNDGKGVQIHLSISVLRQADKSYRKSLEGTIDIGSAVFELDFSTGTAGTMMTARWHQATGRPLGFDELAEALGLSSPGIPKDLDLGLKDASFTYDTNPQGKNFVLTAHSVNYGEAVLAVYKQVTGWQFFFGMDIDRTIDLARLPLIGEPLGRLESVSLKGFQAEVSSAPMDSDQARKFGGLIGQGYPVPPAAGMPKGVALGMTLDAGGTIVPLRLALGGDKPPKVAVAGELHSAAVTRAGIRAEPEASDDGTHWFNLEKSFGPVSIQKVGLRYEESRLWALMNASLTAGPVTLSTFGLGVGTPLSTFEPRFTISGADVAVTAGTVVANGGLIGTIDPVNLYGELLLELGPYSAGALGGFAMIDEAPSFFLYATVSGDFGGPPYFFIKGFAAGIGLNRALVVPPVSGVATFPLVQWAMGDRTPSSIPGDSIGKQIAAALGALSASGVVAPSVGEYWLAAGIKFSSFEIVDSFALVTVSLGPQFELDLLGLSTLRLPPATGLAPVVDIGMQLKATIAPAAGYFAIEGQLTSNSYVIAPAAHVTGGFAFCVWFAGDHEGQFVVSVGGYCDNFKVPEYYPSLPRVGLNWRISDNLSVNGQQYFAVTSAAVMAGCAISAVWKSGPIKAWFDVRADFLMIYKPFHYYIAASCQLGCSVRISLLFTHVTLSFHLGAGIEIWGPDFSGKAHIDLSVISFTIHFGASDQKIDTTIGWTRFVDEMLPGGKLRTSGALKDSAMASEPPVASVIQIQVSKGRLKTLSTTPGELNYVVDGQTFEMLLTSSVPSKDHLFGSNISLAPEILQPSRDGKAITPNTDFGVGPAGVGPSEFSSCFGLTVTGREDVAFEAFRILKNVPTAFWQKREFSDKGVPRIDPIGDASIADALVGWRLAPLALAPDHTLPIRKDLLEQAICATLPSEWSAPKLPGARSFAGETVASTIDGRLARANRPALLAAINRTGLLQVAQTVDIAGLADPASDYLTADPALRLLGGTA